MPRSLPLTCFMNSLLPLALLALSLSACSTLATSPQAPPTEAGALQAAEPEYPSRPFSAESLYELLLAEIAGQRNRADIALTAYAKQAVQTNDPPVLERAIQIAQFLNAQPLSMELAQRWTAVEPQAAEPYYLLILNALRNQRFDLAMPALDTLLKLNPEADLEQIFISAIPNSAEGRNKLLAALDGLADQQSPNIAFARALVLEQNGSFEPALEQARLASKRRPSSVPSILLEARLLTELRRNPDATRLLAQAVKAQPQSRALRLNYARLLVREKQMSAAEDQFATLVQQFPGDSEILLTLGLLALENQHHDIARQSLERLLSLRSHSDEANYYLGALARRQGQADEALNRWAEVDPSSSLFLSAQAESSELRIEQGDLAGARSALAMARSNEPRTAPQLFALEAELLNKAGQPDQAYTLLDEAVRSSPNNELLLYSRAMIADKLGKPQVFEADMRALLKLEPNNATALNALGYTLADRGERLAEAADLIAQAHKLKPNDPAILDSMGWVRFRQGDLPGALSYLEKAYALVQDDEIAAHYGEVLWVAGRRDQARQIWEKALKSSSNSPYVSKTRARLDPPQP